MECVAVGCKDSSRRSDCSCKMEIVFILTFLAPVCLFLFIILFCVCYIKCRRMFQHAPDSDEDENPTVFQLHVRKASQQSGTSQTGSRQEGMERTSQDSSSTSFQPADEVSRGVGTQPILVTGHS